MFLTKISIARWIFSTLQNCLNIIKALIETKDTQFDI
jgi:hypothetical protein